MKKLRFLGVIISIMILCCNTMNVSAATLQDVFCAEYYADSYPDLKAAFGYNERALYRHFLKYGIKENRQCSPIIDIVKYRSSYADLEEAFGNNWNAYVNHYFEYGIKEKRDGGGDFDPVAYAEAYGDIKAAFGNDYEAIAEHYLTYGMKENRTEGVVTLEEKKAAQEAAKRPAEPERPISQAPTPEEEKITCTMTVWTPGYLNAESDSWVKKQCEAFAAEHPNWNITFKFDICGLGDAGEAVTKDVNEAADVFIYTNDNLETLLSANALAKLSGDAATYVNNNFGKTYIDCVSKKGEIYGIPCGANTYFMYYDTSVYSEEDVKSLETMLQKGKVAYPMMNSWYNGAFYLANGAQFFGGVNDGSLGITLGDDNGLRATKYMIDLMENPNFFVGEFGDAMNGLADGSIDAAFSGTWDRTNAETALGDNFGVAALPTITLDGNVCQMKNMSGAYAIGVNATCEYPEVATELALYLGSDSAQVSTYEICGTVPASNGAVAILANDPVVSAVNEIYKNCSIMQPYCAEMAEWWEPAYEIGYEIANGAITYENAAEKTEEFYNAINGK